MDKTTLYAFSLSRSEFQIHDGTHQNQTQKFDTSAKLDLGLSPNPHASKEGASSINGTKFQVESLKTEKYVSNTRRLSLLPPQSLMLIR